MLLLYELLFVAVLAEKCTVTFWFFGLIFGDLCEEMWYMLVVSPGMKCTWEVNHIKSSK